MDENYKIINNSELHNLANGYLPDGTGEIMHFCPTKATILSSKFFIIKNQETYTDDDQLVKKVDVERKPVVWEIINPIVYKGFTDITYVSINNLEISIRKGQDFVIDGNRCKLSHTIEEWTEIYNEIKENSPLKFYKYGKDLPYISNSINIKYIVNTLKNGNDTITELHYAHIYSPYDFKVKIVDMYEERSSPQYLGKGDVYGIGNYITKINEVNRDIYIPFESMMNGFHINPNAEVNGIQCGQNSKYEMTLNGVGIPSEEVYSVDINRKNIDIRIGYKMKNGNGTTIVVDYNDVDNNKPGLRITGITATIGGREYKFNNSYFPLSKHFGNPSISSNIVSVNPGEVNKQKNITMKVVFNKDDFDKLTEKEPVLYGKIGNGQQFLLERINNGYEYQFTNKNITLMEFMQIFLKVEF